MKCLSMAIGLVTIFAFAGVSTIPALAAEGDIVHDSEYYILEAQNAGRWAADGRVPGGRSIDRGH